MTEPEPIPGENVSPEKGAGPEKKAKAGKKTRSSNHAVRRALLTGLAFIVGFVILGIIAIQVWEYSNSVSFCTNVCHKVHPEESAAFQDSYHAEVKCTECHMGRVSTLKGIVLKAGHFRHLPEVIFNNYERPLRSVTMRPANESCEKCHYPPAFHGDRVVEKIRFLPDETNTEKYTYLILKTGAGTRDEGAAYGIHWHVSSPVEYIATDEQKQDIRWVRVTFPDGRTVEYNDVTNPLTPQEIANSTKKTMDCVDCHNRVGHPFPSPSDLTDTALATGAVSTDLPYAKQEMDTLLAAQYPDRAAAEAAVSQAGNQYKKDHPIVATSMPDQIQQAAQETRVLLDKIAFNTAGVSWQSFADNGKHKDFSGCFRCHDGKHLSPGGEAIRLQCNICHGVPQTVGANARVPQMPVANVREPASHLETNFIADHRFQASDECATCHGEIKFGSDDSSFCANSSCHGRAWPSVDLDAAFPHPIPLEGKHAQVLCSQCHQGQRKPEYKCSNCHQPPTATHFGDQCENCHTPEGFDKATLANFQHPVPLEGAHANLQCTACHSGGQKLTYKCANCHKPPSEPHFGQDCEKCHTPAGFDKATLPPELHPIPLVGAHARATCDVCHAAGLRVPEYVCSNCHKPPANHFQAPCDTCHTPEGWVQSASRIVALAPGIPHDLEGRADCLLCHDPAGNIKPAPSNHTGYTSEQCTLCHKAAED